MNKSNKLLLVVALIGLGALVFFLRLHTYGEPLERDLTTYAVIAHEMLQGKSHYSDLFDHKPPAIYVTYALGELIAGYGRDAIFLMNGLWHVRCSLGAACLSPRFIFAFQTALLRPIGTGRRIGREKEMSILA
jgi:hypothetical protein